MTTMVVDSTFYLSHGPPTLSIDDSLPARHFFKSWKDKVFPERPRAILIVSGHWETQEPTVNVVQRNDTIHDFHGFPEPMYQIKYPAPGAPELAKKVKELLQMAGFKRVNEDTKRGLDHGAWIPLMLMYPEADIPVCQLSVQTEKDATYHYNIGKALAPLKEEGVLIIGSGSATHNREIAHSSDNLVVSQISQFDSWLKNALLEGRYEDVKNCEAKVPQAKSAHPQPDHLYPLHFAMGAAGADAKAKLIHHSWSHGIHSKASYQFTTPSAN